MTTGELIALIVAVGGIITAIYTQRTSANKADQERRDKQIDAQFARLTAENEQQATALTDVRKENADLFKQIIDLRRKLQEREEEVYKLQRDLAVERTRTGALEARVNELTAERDALANKKPGTGPLK